MDGMKFRSKGFCLRLKGLEDSLRSRLGFSIIGEINRSGAQVLSFGSIIQAIATQKELICSKV